MRASTLERLLFLFSSITVVKYHLSEAVSTSEERGISISGESFFTGNNRIKLGTHHTEIIENCRYDVYS